MKDALTEVVFDYPYNSFGKTYLAEGTEYPEKFGGNCVFLTQQLSRRLMQQGLIPEYLWNTDATHWATVCREGKSLYYLDPVLLHGEPINISRLQKQKGSMVYNAYPVLNTQPTVVTVTSTGAHSISVNSHGYSQGKMKPIKSYDYDLRDTSTVPPSNWEQVRDANPLSFLRMKVLESEKQATSLFLTNTGFMHIKQPNKPKVYQEKHPEQFQEILERVSTHLRTSTGELLHFFYNGQQLHRERALAMNS